MTQFLMLKRGQKRDDSKPKALGFRPDIQGLRALAVLAVIADHMLAYPSGGFVGVDVFFVISGFIITSMLLREHKKSGRISFADFYRRRAAASCRCPYWSSG
jgi:peptidoglycan/LPS O-acetylase OafA/YrhL